MIKTSLYILPVTPFFKRNEKLFYLCVFNDEKESLKIKKSTKKKYFAFYNKSVSFLKRMIHGFEKKKETRLFIVLLLAVLLLLYKKKNKKSFYLLFYCSFSKHTVSHFTSFLPHLNPLLLPF